MLNSEDSRESNCHRHASGREPCTPPPVRKGYCDDEHEQVRGGRTKTLAASYAIVAMFGLGSLLINTAYWVISSLTTTFNAELGSFSLAALYIAYVLSLLLAPSLVAILGSKTCSVISGVCTLVFTASYFYPQWYTILPSSLVQGLGYGLMYTSLGVTKNDEVRRVVERVKVDEVTYQGRFSAIIIFTCNSAAVIAGLITVTTLSGQHDLYQPDNSTDLLVNNNTHNTTTELIRQICVTLSASTPAASANSTNYYILVAVCTGVAIMSVVVFSITRGATYHQCRVSSFGLREALCRIITRTAQDCVQAFKQTLTPVCALALPLRILHGLMSAYFFGVFTKMYISECIGVEFVGVSVILWGAFSGLGSFSGGWLLRYTASYVIVAITIGLGQTGAIVFLIAWVRQPSFTVVTIMSAIFGLCYGVNSATTLVYAGIGPENRRDIGYSVLIVGSCIGQSVQYILSENITAEANLYVILTVSLLAVPLFSTADLHFGSGRSRQCCGRKQAVEINSQSEHDSKSKGPQERSRSRLATKETAV